MAQRNGGLYHRCVHVFCGRYLHCCCLLNAFHSTSDREYNTASVRLSWWFYMVSVLCTIHYGDLILPADGSAPKHNCGYYTELGPGVFLNSGERIPPV